MPCSVHPKHEQLRTLNLTVRHNKKSCPFSVFRSDATSMPQIQEPNIDIYVFSGLKTQSVERPRRAALLDGGTTCKDGGRTPSNRIIFGPQLNCSNVSNHCHCINISAQQALPTRAVLIVPGSIRCGLPLQM